MKYLFIVQGEGRGHMTQAISLSELLRRNGHQVEEVLIGVSKERKIPDFFWEKIGSRVQTYQSPNFAFSKNNKTINLRRTFLRNLTVGKLRKFKKSMEFIHARIKEVKPDVVVNFYEMLGGFTNLRFRENVRFVSIAHQFVIKHPDYEIGKGSEHGKLLLRLNAIFCSMGAERTLALSFYPFKKNHKNDLWVVPPLLRSEVLRAESYQGDYILSYMLNPGYSTDLIQWHKNNRDVKLQVFWDKKDAPAEQEIQPGLIFHRIDDTKFLKLMAGCRGYITTAGFESVCEAMYLGKPVMMIPAHIEQEMNAAEAESTGAGFVADSFDPTLMIEYLKKTDYSNSEFRKWVDSAEEVFLKHLTVFED